VGQHAAAWDRRRLVGAGTVRNHHRGEVGNTVFDRDRHAVLRDVSDLIEFALFKALSAGLGGLSDGARSLLAPSIEVEEHRLITVDDVEPGSAPGRHDHD
jgi:hypothetical protein